MVDSEKKSDRSVGNRRTFMMLAVIAVGAGVGLYMMTNQSQQASTAGQADTSSSALMQQGPLPENVMGAADAPITLIEYSSMTCPHCATFHKDTLPDIKKKYIDTGKVRFILREFPLDRLALAASMLARCIGPEKYFTFVDALYAEQRIWARQGGNPREGLLRMAKLAGFTETKFDTCIDDKKMLEGIKWVQERGRDTFKVRSTPTFFVNGQLVRGNVGFSGFEKEFAPFLKG